MEGTESEFCSWGSGETRTGRWRNGSALATAREVRFESSDPTIYNEASFHAYNCCSTKKAQAVE